MKSIGETMAIGRNFEECFLKGIRMMNTSFTTFQSNYGYIQEMDMDQLIEELKNPSDKRMFVLFESFYRGISVEDVFNYTLINKWYLTKI